MIEFGIEKNEFWVKSMLVTGVWDMYVGDKFEMLVTDNWWPICDVDDRFFTLKKSPT